MRLVPRLAWYGLIVVTACSDPAGPAGPPPVINQLPRALTGTEQVMIDASNVFGVRLLREVNESFADSNVFLSPLSASMALGMTMNGAAGTTFEEMRATLGFATMTSISVRAVAFLITGLLLDAKVWLTALAAIPAALAGIALARRIYRRVSLPILLRLIYLVLLGTGVSSVARSI